MVTYDYYKKYYAGSVIPEEAFSGAVERAKVVLDKIERTYKVRKCNLTEEFALYRMAEEIYRDDERRDVIQRAVGDVSVRYADPQPLEQRLFKIASMHIDIYRGVSQ